jgi:hypothetical protein
MSRTVAVVWHASFCVAAGVLYFLFVLPRWWELEGTTSHTLGTVLRIVAGLLIGLAALPVVFTLLRTRRPEFGTPQLALTLRLWSIVLHVLAGVLIVGAAISEIWLSLDDAGRWLFGIYGAAAAIALLGILAFYLASVAELPPPPPKPLKVREPKQRRRGRKDAAEDAPAADEDGTADADDAEDAENTDSAAEGEAEPAEVTADTSKDAEAAEPAAGEPAAPAEDSADNGVADGGLRNRRPPGKTDSARRRRRRLRGGVAVED